MKALAVLRKIGQPIGYYPQLGLLFGAKAGLFLGQIIYWEDKGHDPDWIYKSVEDIRGEIGLDYKEQRGARKILVDAGVLEERYDRQSHRLFFRINASKFESLVVALPRPEASTKREDANRRPSDIREGGGRRASTKKAGANVTQEESSTNVSIFHSGIYPDGNSQLPKGKVAPAQTAIRNRTEITTETTQSKTPSESSAADAAAGEAINRVAKRLWCELWQRRYEAPCPWGKETGPQLAKILEKVGCKRESSPPGNPKLSADERRANHEHNLALVGLIEALFSCYMDEGDRYYEGHPPSLLLKKYGLFFARATARLKGRQPPGVKHGNVRPDHRQEKRDREIPQEIELRVVTV